MTLYINVIPLLVDLQYLVGPSVAAETASESTSSGGQEMKRIHLDSSQDNEATFEEI